MNVVNYISIKLLKKKEIGRKEPRAKNGGTGSRKLQKAQRNVRKLRENEAGIIY